MKPQKHKPAVRFFCRVIAVVVIISLFSSVLLSLAYTL